MKIVGINIDGILRDVFSKFEEMYIKSYGEEGITKPFNTIDFKNHFKFESKKTFNEYMEENSDENIMESIEESENTPDQEYFDFLYVDNCLDIFGHANEEYKNVFVDLNKLNLKLRQKGIELKIISKEFGRSRPASLFFLSKNSCEASSIKFVENDFDMWTECDVLITTNPKLFENIPSSKKIIKVIKDYNKELKSDHEINTLNDLIKGNIIEDVLNSNYIDFEVIK